MSNDNGSGQQQGTLWWENVSAHRRESCDKILGCLEESNLVASVVTLEEEAYDEKYPHSSIESWYRLGYSLGNILSSSSTTQKDFSLPSATIKLLEEYSSFKVIQKDDTPPPMYQTYKYFDNSESVLFFNACQKNTSIFSVWKSLIQLVKLLYVQTLDLNYKNTDILDKMDFQVQKQIISVIQSHIKDIANNTISRDFTNEIF